MDKEVEFYKIVVPKFKKLLEPERIRLLAYLISLNDELSLAEYIESKGGENISLTCSQL